MSYGPDYPEMYRRAAIYVDRILGGTRPDGLPVLKPERFNLVVNRATAATLGLVIPRALLVQVDEVV
jgi:putative ABC transport system substrate-binding protein